MCIHTDCSKLCQHLFMVCVTCVCVCVCVCVCACVRARVLARICVSLAGTYLCEIIGTYMCERMVAYSRIYTCLCELWTREHICVSCGHVFECVIGTYL